MFHVKHWFWKLLFDQRGQVPAEGEPPPEPIPAEGEPIPIPAEGTDGEPLSEAAKPGDFLTESKNRAEVMALINGNPDLKKAYGWMQSAYNKKISGRRELEEKASMVDRFYSDPQFATQTIQQWAAQNGYSLTRGQAAAIARESGAPATTGASNVPPQYVEAVRAGLPTELQWMADSIASATFAANQAMMKPIQENAQQQSRVQREREFDSMAKELATVVPGWEEHEDEMSQLLDFMTSPEMKHEKFGSKLRILFDVVTSGASSISEATKRINQAAKNKSSFSRNGSSSAPNLDERIRGAAKKNINDAWKIAGDHAQETLQRQGSRIP